MKEYIKRLNDGCPKRRFAFWWIFRLLMIYAFVASFLRDPFDFTYPLQIGIALSGTFIWEIGIAFPKRTPFPYMPSTLQSVLIPVLFAFAFGGKFMNLCYEIGWWDPALHCFFGAFTVFYGYEFACAVMKSDKHGVTKAMAFFVGFGFSFAVLNLWELTEFGLDQLMGHITGHAGDLQHWTYELAEGITKAEPIINPIDPVRRALMYTMDDIIINTVSAFVGLIIINIYPYRHRGKYKYDIAVAPFNKSEKRTEKLSAKDNAKRLVKEYFLRLKTECPKSVYALWWVIRLCMVYLIITSFFEEPFNIKHPLELLANLSCMFIWELCMAMPKNYNVFRHIHHSLVTFIIVGDFLTVIAGYVLNFYYTIRLWDSLLHFLCGIIGVFYGYEIACALVKMEKKTASKSMILLAAAGFCFMCTTLWEIFEFGCDQGLGMYLGDPANVQHWSYLRALGTAKEVTLFNYFDMGRWPIMDTMGDMVLNVSGITLASIFLGIFPYRNKGRFKYPFLFDENIANVKEKV